MQDLTIASQVQVCKQFPAQQLDAASYAEARAPAAPAAEPQADAPEASPQELRGGLSDVGHVDFDLDRILQGFSTNKVLESSSEPKVRSCLSKVKFLKRLDSLAHPHIRIFKEGRLFLLLEHINPRETGSSSRPTAPTPSVHKASKVKSPQPQRRKKTAHLVPGPPQGQALRYWSGATGSDEAPQPFMKWGPSPPKFPPPHRPPQQLLKAKPKAPQAVRSSPGPDLFESVSAAKDAEPALARSAEPSQAAHMQQVSNMLRSLAAPIAPRQPLADVTEA